MAALTLFHYISRRRIEVDALRRSNKTRKMGVYITVDISNEDNVVGRPRPPGFCGAARLQRRRETILHKEEPRELKVSELAPEEFNIGETEEEIKESFEIVSKADSQSTGVVSKDEIIAY
ncbi:uncharacterized protein Pyn_37514 [Prunus yedoensis var. nudiflora]|uniref:Uncharacterized protein n=1 Tax=Prunus yedoensis var. nudiflora TaxID=2094558 RepID=A0A314UYB0_PRUYE|nr:uncharacterized protein Pyn_37514 [Prunus yedoensis var. nudiflora]